MPSQERSTGGEATVVQMSPDMAARLVDALERLANSQSFEAAADFRTALATETNNAIARWQTEALMSIADRFSQSQTGPQLTLPQRQLALRYDAFRTALGRQGAASIVYGVPGDDAISILGDNVPGIALTFVGFSSTGNEVPLSPRPPVIDDGQGLRHVVIRGLDKLDIARFELRNHADQPILLGLIIHPAPVVIS
jgi:hypothetical protein